MVGVFDTMNSGSDSEDEETSTKDQTIGIMLILGQSIMSVCQGEWRLQAFSAPFVAPLLISACIM